jgi:hypothetical protein
MLVQVSMLGWVFRCSFCSRIPLTVLTFEQLVVVFSSAVVDDGLHPQLYCSYSLAEVLMALSVERQVWEASWALNRGPARAVLEEVLLVLTWY